MGGAQPLAVTMNGGVALVVEVDPQRIERRLRTGYVDEQHRPSTRRWPASSSGATDGTARSMALDGNAADVLPELVRRGVHARRRHRDR